MFAVAVGVSVLLIIGAPMLGSGTSDWVHAPIQRTRGVVDAHWDVTSGFVTACVSQLRVLDGAAASPASWRVNTTTLGLCAPDAVDRLVVNMCQPRGRPDAAIYTGEWCGNGEDGTLAIIVIGGVALAGAVLLTLVGVLAEVRRARLARILEEQGQRHQPHQPTGGQLAGQGQGQHPHHPTGGLTQLVWP
jgi:hypothetical protein